MILKQIQIVSNSRSWRVIEFFLHMSLPSMVDLVSDALRRESAIAEDFWSSILKHDTNDRMEITLKNIEQKWEGLLLISIPDVNFFKELIVLHRIFKMIISVLW